MARRQHQLLLDWPASFASTCAGADSRNVVQTKVWCGRGTELAPGFCGISK
jgi:hypothetical protein